METQPESNSRLRQIELALRSADRFDVPQSDGYSVYSALLALLQSADDEASQRVHDSEIGSLHTSGLRGAFGDGDRSHHKQVLPNTEYTLSLGVTDPGDEAIFEALVSALVLADEPLGLTHGQLQIVSFESMKTSHESLLTEADELNDPTIEMEFRTATCIEEAGSVTTMFPTRGAVFGSLLGKWNNTAPELELDMSGETLAESVIEKPDARSYDTHSVLVNRVDDPDGGTQPIFRQGFSGTCAYAFKDASESVVNAVTALALFAEYSGVGSAVARGCGDVSVEVTEQ
ncbi:CRISPR system precrRNA processing endoribonuclease RAMP protein Cas6 [Halorubrum ezzemoulense]|uniref:CRISPR system precrRNA processing endoribonuclease RAMP protein Cas6 n=1 Tax=Halorubrum ezzemoulense TaxID=337243 RepID=UPI00232BC7C6|nr:CRISPR system precrRNA processing endoribonuclease RAMP protein Cas6 [Halorubrum ezzemoulense]MDB9253956.1 CRISPR system precrRNA processing endoribonuclease RAMP protein Cas6 [Halorubrum ezzemoulense]MDB9257150.1 CRISPR system precrRNA processing endoribonuclease RAMP protein Cas6 [Halorubrum ezzemoulense]MDB9277960.1 CRISPR system precrRNA processing endoribonuclease RAMP protein Cas6 [Halorubrum ezzemoulense]